MPERFDLVYTDSDGTRKRPVMLHRVILGAVERFLGVLIEHTAGALPVWLSPEQARVLTVTEAQDEFAAEAKSRLEHGRGGLVGEQSLGSSQSFQDVVAQWAQIPSRFANPIRQR